MVQTAIGTRRSILEIQTNFDNKTDTKTLEDLMTAWAGIKALDPSDLNSFFVIGGYHGEPFRGAGYGSSAWWGGWCNHGNVLFPTWHRLYLKRLETALQSIPGCDNVMLPYWDETDEYSLAQGIPSCLTDEFFTYSDGRQIPNPLRSFSFPVNITDNVSTDQEGSGGLYTKQAGYTTVRYPYSGLVGTASDQAATALHNSQWTPAEAVAVLNNNVVNWLNLAVVSIQPDKVNNNTTVKAGIHAAYQNCLDAPNYTVFSNTTSCQHYNDLLPTGAVTAMPLEQPHNDVHLAVGGADITTVAAQDFDASPIVGANGDMGENDTAGLDPIFYFHHCNVDRMFWVWQKKHGHTDSLEIIPEYPGTNSVDNQGPTPGVAGNVWLSMDSPLMPFVDANGEAHVSRDVVNIEKQLDYTYSIGSLDQQSWTPTAPGKRKTMSVSEGYSDQILVVTGANKAAVSGSFLIAGYATVQGEKYLVGVQSVLSRNAIQGCANCQTHLNVKAHFSLHHLRQDVVAHPDTIFSAEIVGHRNTVALDGEGIPSTPTPRRKALRVSLK
jgi:tyrosinase